jgi:hypothetical protein
MPILYQRKFLFFPPHVALGLLHIIAAAAEKIPRPTEKYVSISNTIGIEPERARKMMVSLTHLVAMGLD